VLPKQSPTSASQVPAGLAFFLEQVSMVAAFMWAATYRPVTSKFCRSAP
jgi:hypothetical protein